MADYPDRIIELLASVVGPRVLVDSVKISTEPVGSVEISSFKKAVDRRLPWPIQYVSLTVQSKPTAHRPSITGFPSYTMARMLMTVSGRWIFLHTGPDIALVGNDLHLGAYSLPMKVRPRLRS